MKWSNSRQILIINHAGEWGAIHFYKAQSRVAARFYPQLLPVLDDFLRNEYTHLALFADLMAQRNIQPSKALWVWQYGGAFLGFFTALLGTQAAMLATCVFEQCVVQHLDAQLRYLHTHDTALTQVIEAIYQDELHHGAAAKPHTTHLQWHHRPIAGLVRGVTESIMLINGWYYATPALTNRRFKWKIHP